MKRNLSQTIFFSILVMHLVWSVQACKKCGSYPITEQNMVSVFRLIDTIQVIHKIGYVGSSYAVFPGKNQSEFLVSTSDSFTQVVLFTSMGIDTVLFYQNRIIEFIPEDDCREKDEIAITRGSLQILSHTFDSVYTYIEAVPPGTTYNRDQIFHKQYTVCVK